MNFHRQYKLYKLGVPVPDVYRKFFELAEFKFSNLQIYKNKNYVNILFFINPEGECIIEYLTLIKCVYVNICPDFIDFEVPYNKEEIAVLEFLKNRIVTIYPFVEIDNEFTSSLGSNLYGAKEYNFLNDRDTVLVKNTKFLKL